MQRNFLNHCMPSDSLWCWNFWKNWLETSFHFHHRNNRSHRQRNHLFIIQWINFHLPSVLLTMVKSVFGMKLYNRDQPGFIVYTFQFGSDCFVQSRCFPIALQKQFLVVPSMTIIFPQNVSLLAESKHSSTVCSWLPNFFQSVPSLPPQLQFSHTFVYLFPKI